MVNLGSLRRGLETTRKHSKAGSLFSKLRGYDPVKRSKHPYVFDIRRLLENPDLSKLTVQTGLSSKAVLYTLDTVLRYPLYGELVGPDVFFCVIRFALFLTFLP